MYTVSWFDFISERKNRLIEFMSFKSIFTDLIVEGTFLKSEIKNSLPASCFASFKKHSGRLNPESLKLNLQMKDLN